MNPTQMINLIVRSVIRATIWQIARRSSTAGLWLGLGLAIVAGLALGHGR
jgi:hypothetical protein